MSVLLTDQAIISLTDTTLLKIVLILIPVTLGFFWLYFAYLCYKLYLEFGWMVYKRIGAVLYCLILGP